MRLGRTGTKSVVLVGGAIPFRFFVHPAQAVDFQPSVPMGFAPRYHQNSGLLAGCLIRALSFWLVDGLRPYYRDEASVIIPNIHCYESTEGLDDHH